MNINKPKRWPADMQKEEIQRLFPCFRSAGNFFVLLLLLFPLANACADLRLRVGARPDTKVLETDLHVGKSTQSDVLNALGRPDGKGKSFLPIHTSKKELWSYYYEEGSLKDSRRIFLFVFFDQDQYDGYMWFSSLPE